MKSNNLYGWLTTIEEKKNGMRRTSRSASDAPGPYTFWAYDGIGGFTSTTNMMLFSRSKLGTESFLFVHVSVFGINMVVNILL